MLLPAKEQQAGTTSPQSLIRKYVLLEFISKQENTKFVTADLPGQILLDSPAYFFSKENTRYVSKRAVG